MANTVRTLNPKLVLLGEAAVGKSSAVDRFVKNDFFEFQQPTIGAAFMTQTMKLSDCVVKFEIWDTAGQERYRSLAPMYYRGAAAALVVYDITDHDSFNGAKTWIDELTRLGSTDIVIALAGNKSDLNDKREVLTSEAKAYAQENGCIFFETSAKTGENINDVFRAIAEKLPKHQPAAAAAANNVSITDDFSNDNSKKGCC